MVDVERLFELMNEPVEVSDVPSAIPLNIKGGEVVFDHVSFSYEQGEDEYDQILKDISFKVSAGTSVAIVGQVIIIKRISVLIFFSVWRGKKYYF